MKILFIHNAYGRYSGEEAVVDAQLALLRSHGHEVVLYSRSSGDLGPQFYGKYVAFFTGLYNPGSIVRIKRLLRTFQPEVVHVHNLYPSVSPSVLPGIRKRGIPVVMTVHNYRLVCPNGLFFTNEAICERCTGSGRELNCIAHNCERNILKSSGYALRNWWARMRGYYANQVNAFACLTEFQRTKLIFNGFPSARMELLPNFLSSEHINAVSEEDRLSGATPGYAAFVGRLNHQKGFDTLCEAMFLNTDILLHAAGAPDEKQLEKIILPPNIVICDELDKEEMRQFWLSSRFLVFTSSSYEGFPMVFLEAMLHRLPVIAPRMAGYPEIIVDKFNGLLYTPDDEYDLADKIRRLWEDEALCARLGENGYRIMKEKYSDEVFYNGLMEVYEKVINENMLT